MVFSVELITTAVEVEGTVRKDIKKATKMDINMNPIAMVDVVDKVDAAMAEDSDHCTIPISTVSGMISMDTASRNIWWPREKVTMYHLTISI
jgi:hypothetical protein